MTIVGSNAVPPRDQRLAPSRCPSVHRFEGAIVSGHGGQKPFARLLAQSLRTNNLVIATPGPFNVAGLVNQTGKTVTNNIH